MACHYFFYLINKNKHQVLINIQTFINELFVVIIIDYLKIVIIFAPRSEKFSSFGILILSYKHMVFKNSLIKKYILSLYVSQMYSFYFSFQLLLWSPFYLTINTIHYIKVGPFTQLSFLCKPWWISMMVLILFIFFSNQINKNRTLLPENFFYD